MKIAPSILSANFANLLEDIKRVEKGADLLHIDVMDGHFVPNITIGPAVVKSLRKFSSLPFDVHLMIENPDLYIEDFVSSGADNITVHQEACLHLHRTIQKNKGVWNKGWCFSKSCYSSRDYKVCFARRRCCFDNDSRSRFWRTKVCRYYA